MEGKEVRFGVSGAGLSLAVATDSTVGAGNFAYDSLTPLGGLVALVDMQLGEVAFGGVGSGLYGMLAFVLLTVFVAGLRVGRTPEYLGNKIERREITLVIIALLVFPLSILLPSALAAVLKARTATLLNPGPHGFSEIFYAFTSSAASNGSAMAGRGTNAFYNVLTGLTMGFARYAAIIPTLALAGSFRQAAQRPHARNAADRYAALHRSHTCEHHRRSCPYVSARRRARPDRRPHHAARRKDVLTRI